MSTYFFGLEESYSKQSVLYSIVLVSRAHIHHDIFYSERTGGVYFKLMSAPFVVGLCWAYVCYRKNIYGHDLKSIVKDDRA
jgi:hypothetical protein